MRRPQVQLVPVLDRFIDVPWEIDVGATEGIDKSALRVTNLAEELIPGAGPNSISRVGLPPTRIRVLGK